MLNTGRRRNHAAGAHSPHDVILVTLDDPNHNTRPTNRIADARRYQASSIATRMLMNTDSARTRHCHASALLLAGTPEWVVSRRLGHAHVQTTIDLYGWVREDEALQAAANWKSYASSWQVPDGR